MNYKLCTILAAIITAMAFATIIEGMYGSERAYAIVYSTAWFKLLWALLAFSGIYIIAKSRMLRNVPALLLHASFIIILTGALITSLTSSKQKLHLRQGEDSGNNLPFKIKLERFQIKNYPGTDCPQDYVSTITTSNGERATISMNNIFIHNGYRFYQTSYDHDLHGTTLTVTHDPYGTTITYTGYALLILSVIMLLISPRSHFRRLLRKCKSKGLLSLLLLFAISTNANAHQTTPRTITEQEATTAARQQVIYNNRIVPLRTLALDFCQKVTGGRHFRELTAERFMLSLMQYPEDWQHIRFIKTEDKRIRQRLHINDTHAALADLFGPDGSYRLAGIKDAQKIDERCGMIAMLLDGSLIQPLKDNDARLSEAIITTELIYDAAPWSLILFISTIIILIIGFCLLLTGTKGMACNILCVATATLTTALLTLYTIRWVIQGHIPLSNGYETMLFIALLSTIFATAITCQKLHTISLLTLLSLTLAAFTLLVSHLSFMSPAMTPLMPVLQSPWLTIHVSLIMVSYALFAIITLIAIAYFIRNLTSHPLSSTKNYEPYAMVGEVQEHQQERKNYELCTMHYELLTLTSRLLLYPATLLLAVGIFIGAVWANVSWGTYWSWDPKETWALITLLIYAIPLHPHLFRKISSEHAYHAYILCAFLSVLITYFGVNYIIGGMHSYA